MKKRNKVLSSALALTLLVGSLSFAYFTDRAEATFAGNVGTMCLKEINTEHDLRAMYPGHKRGVKYSYENQSDEPTDTRITYMVNHERNLSGPLLTIKDGEEIMVFTDEENKHITPGPTIEPRGILDKELEVELSEEVDNSAQGLSFAITVIIEGKQSSDADWSKMNSKTITVNGNEVEVVEESPCKIVIDYTPYFDFSPLPGGEDSVNGFTQGVSDVIEELGEVDANFINNPIIPSEYKGRPVTEIKYRAFMDYNLTSVVIPDGVKTIGREAFRYNQLTSIEIPNSVTSIGPAAFSNNELTSVDIPYSVTEIGQQAFNINKLPDRSAYIYARNNDGSIDKTHIVSYGGANAYPIIPDNVKVIGERAFYYSKLTAVEIPNSVTEIGVSAFYGSQLTSVVIPDSVTEIGASAFRSNELRSVVIPDSVTEIGIYAFHDNGRWGTVYINELEGDKWPKLRGYIFSTTTGTSWSRKPLSEYQP